MYVQIIIGRNFCKPTNLFIMNGQVGDDLGFGGFTGQTQQEKE